MHPFAEETGNCTTKKKDEKILVKLDHEGKTKWMFMYMEAEGRHLGKNIAAGRPYEDQESVGALSS